MDGTGEKRTIELSFIYTFWIPIFTYLQNVNTIIQ